MADFVKAHLHTYGNVWKCLEMGVVSSMYMVEFHEAKKPIFVITEAM